MKNLFFAVLIALTSTISAHAITTTDFVQVTNGMFDGAPGFTTWAMRITADATDWTNADLDINLTSGTMNQITGLFGAAVPDPQGLGDTAVFAPLNSLGDLTSGAFGGAALTVAGGPSGPFVEGPQIFQASWGTTFTGDVNRTFDTAMISLSNDAEGTLDFRSISNTEVENGGIGNFPALFRITGGQIVPAGIIPEPGTISLAGLSLAGLLLKRRRS